MTIGSRAADAPVRRTAEAVNRDKRDLPILVMFADVCKNERRELKMTDGGEGGKRKCEDRSCRVQEKTGKGQFRDENWEEAQDAENTSQPGRQSRGRQGG
jgi:hypothetical protein